jgi:enoyl-CoA hydratase/carnithine racemase
MDYVKSDKQGQVEFITMARGKANPINSQMIEELATTFTAASADENVRSVVLASDGPGFFCAGFDVKEVFRFDRIGIEKFFGSFIDLYEFISRFPKPVVAAVNGHAYAGGAVLALACDTRVFAKGSYGFALNEIDLGIVLPPGLVRLANCAVSTSVAREMAFGRNLNPEAAFDCGLASSLVEAEEIRSVALEVAEGLGKKPPLAFSGVKKLFLAVAGNRPEDSDRVWLPEFLDHWFSKESQELRGKLVASMSR